jgi:hypothetical protein
MIGKSYLATQAATLLKIARITRNPSAAAALTAKAAEMQAKAADDPAPDRSPNPPDVEITRQ